MKYTMQDYFDLGNDTEKWWKQTVSNFMPCRAAGRCRTHDLVHTSATGHKFYIDVKFWRRPVRKKGWVEAVSRGKRTGIFDKAIETQQIQTASAMIAILDVGMYYLIDANEILTAYKAGELQLHEQTVVDDEGNEAATKYFLLDGFDDPRFLMFSGPMSITNWAPETAVGKSFDMEEWISWRNRK